ncbi:hypothetical protein Angca_006349 [Angiostrongylus cantonensis]|nr:hypothetical protein Angca_006349 [Angiostrongylus cantonensis]
MQKGPDYGAIIIRTAAGVVIFISLSLIVLVVGNMIYTSLTNQVHFRERVSDVFSRLLYTVSFKSKCPGQSHLAVFQVLHSVPFFQFSFLNLCFALETTVSTFLFRLQRHLSRFTMYPASQQLTRFLSRARITPFCRCFSHETSESETDEETTPEDVGRNWSGSISELVRQRLAVVGEASNQAAGPIVLRRSLQVNNNITPVHRIVEYSHHLVPDVEKILSASYYWGVMDRFQAEQLLEGKAEGTFILRDSAQTEYLFSVSFRRYQRTLHARIEQGNHRFSFDIHDQSVYSAPTITKLIEKYNDPARCLFFEPQLRQPLHRRHVFSLQELCRGVIISHTTYTGVASLHIPSKLKQYIREYHYTVAVRSVTVQE